MSKTPNLKREAIPTCIFSTYQLGCRTHLQRKMEKGRRVGCLENEMIIRIQSDTEKVEVI